MIRRRQAICIEDIRTRDCLLNNYIDGKVEGTPVLGRRGIQLVDDLKEKENISSSEKGCQRYE